MSTESSTPDHDRGATSVMKRVTFRIPESEIDDLEDLVDEKGEYPNRSEAIRAAVRDLVRREGS